METIEEGLGPVFNGKSCAECHAVPSMGGSEPNVGVARETRISRIFNGRFDPLDGSVSVNRGGGLLQQRAIDVPGCTAEGGGRAPRSHLRLAAQHHAVVWRGADGSHSGRHYFGEPTMAANPTRVEPRHRGAELGRFGWKAQVATLHQFAGDAYLNEMGITNPSFPHENLPQGQPIPPGCDTVADPEDDGSGVTAFTNFMRFLAPAPRGPVTPQVQHESKCLVRLGAPVAMCPR